MCVRKQRHVLPGKIRTRIAMWLGTEQESLDGKMTKQQLRERLQTKFGVSDDYSSSLDNLIDDSGIKTTSNGLAGTTINSAMNSRVVFLAKVLEMVVRETEVPMEPIILKALHNIAIGKKADHGLDEAN